MNNDNLNSEKGKNKNKDGIIEGIFSLFELLATYAKEQLSSIVYKSLLSPIESFKKSISAAILGAFLYGTAAIFISISFILLLMEFLPKWTSYLIVAVILILAGVLINKKNLIDS